MTLQCKDLQSSLTSNRLIERRDLNVPHCVYLWNKMFSRMSGQKSSRWFMFFHSYKSSRRTHSLSVWECVCANPKRNVQRAFEFHSSSSVRISPARNAPEEMRAWRRSLSLHCWAERVKCFLESRGSLNTTAAPVPTHVWLEVNTLSEARQRRVSRRTGVHWECRGHTALINTVWYGSYKELVIGTHS